MPVSRILWGPTLETPLDFGYSLFDVLTDREPRDGSEWARSPGGAEDAWITGRDYALQCNARFIPDGPNASPVQSAVSGPTGFQSFLDWTRDKNPVRFVPDIGNPLFYLDNVYLVDPLKGFGSLGGDLKRAVSLKFRNASVDFHQALRGVMFEYAPGASLIDPVAATFVRGSVAERVASDLSLASDLANVLRDRHYVGAQRTALLELSRTNSCLQSEAIDNASWSKVGGPPTVVADATAAPDGATTADRVVPAISSQNPDVEQAITITANEFVALSVFVKASGYVGAVLRITDGLTTNGFQANFDASTGLFGTIHNGFGAGVLMEFRAVALKNGWYRIELRGSIGSGVTAAIVKLFVYDTIAHANAQTAFTGDGTSGLYVWGAQLERMGTTIAAPPSSYIKTATVAVTRSVDNLDFPFTYPPQAMFLLLDFIDAGLGAGSAGNSFAVEIGNAASDGRLIIDTGGGQVTVYHQANGGSVASQIATTVATGDRLQVLLLLRPDGSVQVKRVQNLGAEGAGGQSGAQSFRLAGWNPQKIQFYGGTMLGCGLVRCVAGPLTWGGVNRDTVAAALAA